MEERGELHDMDGVRACLLEQGHQHAHCADGLVAVDAPRRLPQPCNLRFSEQLVQCLCTGSLVSGLMLSVRGNNMHAWYKMLSTASTSEALEARKVLAICGSYSLLEGDLTSLVAI